jgi:hypothetical protein
MITWISLGRCGHRTFENRTQILLPCVDVDTKSDYMEILS